MKLHAFEITFRPARLQVYQIKWIRFYPNFREAAFDVCNVLAHEYPAAELDSMRQLSADEDPRYTENRAAIDCYARRMLVALNFALQCASDTEAHYAYLNARWAARLALAELGREAQS